MLIYSNYTIHYYLSTVLTIHYTQLGKLQASKFINSTACGDNEKLCTL